MMSWINIALGQSRRRLNEETGAIALATLAFCMSAGIAILVLLWGLAQTTGAYNALYAATQSSAYAAVTATKTARVGGYDQLIFDCTTRGGTDTVGKTRCQGGSTFDAADQVLKQVLGVGQPGRFKLLYAPGNPKNNVYLADENYAIASPPEIRVYEVDSSSGSLASQNCTFPNTSDYGYPDGDTTQLPICWRVREFGTQFVPQTQSGVIVRTRAQLPFLGSGCTLPGICKTINMQILAAATESQPSPPTRF